MLRTTCALLMLVLILPQTTRAADSIGVDLTADFCSKYIWRGQNLNDDYVFQPGIAITYGGLTAAIWGNLDLTGYNRNAGEFTEFDFSLDYSGTVPGIDALDFSVGVIHYRFPGVPGDTTELYWGFALDAPLNPSITVYHDIDEIKGSYISLGLGHTIDNIVELAPGMPVGMQIGASLGIGTSDYNKGYWGVGGTRVNDLAFSVAWPIEIAGFTLTPSINYVTLVSSELRRSDAYARGSDYFYTCLSLSKSF